MFEQITRQGGVIYLPLKTLNRIKLASLNYNFSLDDLNEKGLNRFIDCAIKNRRLNKEFIIKNLNASINKNNISTEEYLLFKTIDDKTCEKLKYAMSILEIKNEDEVINCILFCGLEIYTRMVPSLLSTVSESRPLVSPIYKIERWIERKRTPGYFMLRAFVQACGDKKTCDRNEMMEHFCMDYHLFKPTENESFLPNRFINLFRMMCSRAPGAYGEIFKYSQKDNIVSLNEEFEKYVFSKKEELTNIIRL